MQPERHGLKIRRKQEKRLIETLGPVQKPVSPNKAINKEFNPQQKQPKPQRFISGPLVTTMPPYKRPVFRTRPDPRPVVVQEGSPLLLRCELDQLFEGSFSALWSRNVTETIAFWLDEQEKIAPKSGYEFRGNTLQGDYSIELNSARPSDSGKYICQVMPVADVKPPYTLDDYRIETDVIVEPAPQIILPQAMNIGSNWTKLTTSSSGSLNEFHPTGGNYISASYSNRRPSSSLAASTSALQNNQLNYHHHHHLHGAASTSGGGGGASSAASQGGAQSLRLLVALNWPYALMVLLGCLFIVNIYLISRLVQTCRRRRRLLHQQHQDHKGHEAAAAARSTPTITTTPTTTTTSSTLTTMAHSQQGFSSTSNSTTSNSSKPSSQCSLRC